MNLVEGAGGGQTWVFGDWVEDADADEGYEDNPCGCAECDCDGIDGSCDACTDGDEDEPGARPPTTSSPAAAQDFVRVYSEDVYGVPPEQVVGSSILGAGASRLCTSSPPSPPPPATVLVQEAVPDKTRELAAIPQLLARLGVDEGVKGALVSIASEVTWRGTSSAALLRTAPFSEVAPLLPGRDLGGGSISTLCRKVAAGEAREVHSEAVLHRRQRVHNRERRVAQSALRRRAGYGHRREPPGELQHPLGSRAPQGAVAVEPRPPSGVCLMPDTHSREPLHLAGLAAILREQADKI